MNQATILSRLALANHNILSRLEHHLWHAHRIEQEEQITGRAIAIAAGQNVVKQEEQRVPLMHLAQVDSVQVKEADHATQAQQNDSLQNTKVDTVVKAKIYVLSEEQANERLEEAIEQMHRKKVDFAIEHAVTEDILEDENNIDIQTNSKNSKGVKKKKKNKEKVYASDDDKLYARYAYNSSDWTKVESDDDIDTYG